jgi:murein DD-endopeptidase MepM/ murein hydrolase activator NlpD
MAPRPRRPIRFSGDFRKTVAGTGVAALVFLTVACGQGHSPVTPSAPARPADTTSEGACGDAPDNTNTVLPLLSRPFVGDYVLTNFFDHNLPFEFNDHNGYQLTWCGQRVFGRVDGHSGYDWLLPAGTPLLATVGGSVTIAGTDPPFWCPALGRTVSDQLVVSIRSDGPDAYDSQYLHLSRVDVIVNQRLTQGDVIGLSGNTGCSTAPHLHFQVRALTGRNPGALVDPYGWQGKGIDPWSQHPDGHSSAWLWQPGEAPLLRPQ